MSSSDESFMRLALREAAQAAAAGEVPIGAVIVRDGEVVGRGRNRREELADPTAHAEVLAIRDAARHIGDWRLEGTTLYVTVEPCPMCAGAIVLARVPEVVYGVPDPKAGAAGTLLNLLQDDRLNHRAQVRAGVLAEECREALQRFFGGLRRREYSTE